MTPTTSDTDAAQQAQDYLRQAGIRRRDHLAATATAHLSGSGRRLAAVLRRLRPRLPTSIDISATAVWCVLIALASFVAFDVTSTFPVSVKFAIASLLFMALGAVLLLASVWRQRRGQ